MNAPEFTGQGSFHIWKQFLIMCKVSPLSSNHLTLTFFSPSINWDHIFLSCFGIERGFPEYLRGYSAALVGEDIAKFESI